MRLRDMDLCVWRGGGGGGGGGGAYTVDPFCIVYTNFIIRYYNKIYWCA